MLRSEVDDIADTAPADGDTPTAARHEGVEWLMRVLRCAIDGEATPAE